MMVYDIMRQVGAIMARPRCPRDMWMVLFRRAAMVYPIKGARKTREMTV